MSKKQSSSKSIILVETKAREHLLAGRWRQARENCKKLCKVDRAKFEPLLIEANAGLAREMIERGLVSEAEPVVAHLRTFAPVDLIRSLERAMASKTGAAPKQLPDILSFLGRENASIAPGEQMVLADQLVVAFTPIPVEAAEGEAISNELNAVQNALEAISGGNLDQALELTRPLGRDSVFGHWKLFIKGLAAFHRGEKEKAARAFGELPGESVPGRARAAYLLLLGTMPLRKGPPPAPVLEVALELAGTGSGARWMGRAEALWRMGKHVASYKVVREALPSFPCEGLDLSSALTEFYFNSVFSMGEAAEKYANFFISLEEGGHAKNQVELIRIRRSFCLLLERELSSDGLQPKWELYLEGYQKMHGSNPRLASLGYGWLGQVFATIRRPSFFDFENKPPMRDMERAIAMLKKSIQLDPLNDASYLLLCHVYEIGKKKSEFNRLLDEMTQRFPENKAVLVQAGSGCLERKAYFKGIEYLERALALDRLDPAAPDLLVSGCIRLARQYFQKGKIIEGRNTLERAGLLLVELPENFLRNPWCHDLWRGALETLYGDSSRGADLLARARSKSPAPAVFLFFGRLVWSFCAKEILSDPPFEAEFREAQGNATAAQAALLLRIWLFWRKQPEALAWRVEEKWLLEYIKEAVKNPFTRDEAKQVVELLKGTDFHSQGFAFTSAVLKQDAKDPWFRLYDQLLQPFHLDDPERDRKNYQAILEEATRRGDQAAAKLARELLAEMGRQPPMFGPPEWDEFEESFEEEDEYDDDDDDEDEEDEEDDDEKASFLPPGTSAETVLVLKALFDVMAHASKADIAEMRQALPQEMPREIFDDLVSMARSGLPFPGFASDVLEPEGLPGAAPPPAKSAAKPQPKRAPKDPNQLNLF